jgi:c-di-GMP-binding flagellar brake protein YcgR
MSQNDADMDQFFETGKRVAIELGTALNFQVHGVESRLKSSFVGMEPGKYAIIKIPHGPDGFQSKLYKGNSIIVRYMHEGTVYGFQTQILNTITEPARLLFIEYPKVIEEHSLRSSQRIDCYLPCKFRLTSQVENDAGEQVDTENEVDGVVVDLSNVGCRGTFDSSGAESNLLNTKKETAISISIQLPGVSDDVNLSGVVKSLHSDQSITSIGIHFNDMEEGIQEKIGRYLSIAS